ncbi:biotin/lipoyl-containing protein, partial [Pseudoalteromonas sp. S1650]|uniref:biotin/lipoyl-containing protein n=1 Tax=Pseudoalteromonas sp. S1650 TaxID=579509 RepID=UPI001286F501
PSATFATCQDLPGDAVTREQTLVDIETDKVVLEVVAQEDGIMGEHIHAEGETVLGEQVIGTVKAGAAPAAAAPKAEAAAPAAPMGDRTQKRVPMTRLRKTIANRLLEAKNSTAMLT